MDVPRARDIHRAPGRRHPAFTLREPHIDILHAEADVERTVLRAVEGKDAFLALQPCAHPVHGRRLGRFSPAMRPGGGIERVAIRSADLGGHGLDRTEQVECAVYGEHILETARHRNLRVRQEDISGMVQPKAELPENVLLGILRPHAFAKMAQRREVAARSRSLEAPVRRSHQGRHRAAAALAHEADLGRIDLRTGFGIVDRAHPVPDAEHRHRPAEQRRLYPNDVVVRRGAFAGEFAAFSLFVRIIHQRDKALLDGDDASPQVDVAVLAFVRMPAAHHHGGIRSLECIRFGDEEVCGHEQVRH